MTDVNSKKVLLDENFTKLQNVLNEAQKDFGGDPKSFYKTNIFKMGRFIRLYADLMKQMNTKLNEDFKEELDNVDFEMNLEKKEAYLDKLSIFINEWDSFLKEIELKGSSDLEQNFQIGNMAPDCVKNEVYLSQILAEKPEQFDKICLSNLHLRFREKQNLISEKSFMLLVMLRHFA